LVAGSLVALLAGKAVAAAPVAPPGHVPAVQGAERGEIEPHAGELLKRMSDHLSGLKAFSFRAVATTDVMLVTGQKLQFAAVSEVFVCRPNHLRSNRVGEVADLEFYYDGATVTLFSKRHNYYATTPAPPTMDEMLDDIRARLDIEAPAADLLYEDVHGGLMAETSSMSWCPRPDASRCPSL
jgi:hypothetical protein